MAFSAGGVVEIRSTGAADNGGYWNPNIVGAGTDYTQSDLPIASGGDGDCNNSTTFTANGSTPFTNQMVGNAIHIQGTGFTTGWYEIRTFNSTSSIVLDRNPTGGGHPTTGSYKIGGAITVYDTLCTTVTTDTTAHVKKGTYSWGTNSINASGNGGLGGIRGYKTSRNDNPTGADRPSITITGGMSVGNSSVLKDLIISGSFAGTLVAGGTFGTFINCKFTQSVGSAQTALTSGANSVAIGCEIICTNGTALNSIYHQLSCYVHDSVTGILLANPGTVVNCVVDTCTTGIKANTATGNYNIYNSTVYNCTTGVDVSSNQTAIICANTIIKACTNGVIGSLSYRQVMLNDVLDNSTNTTNVNYLINDVLSNPNMTDPANGDFTISGTSPAYKAALGIGTNVGAVGVYNTSSGVSSPAGFTGQIQSVS